MIYLDILMGGHHIRSKDKFCLPLCDSLLSFRAVVRHYRGYDNVLPNNITRDAYTCEGR